MQKENVTEKNTDTDNKNKHLLLTIWELFL